MHKPVPKGEAKEIFNDCEAQIGLEVLLILGFVVIPLAGLVPLGLRMTQEFNALIAGQVFLPVP